LLQLKDESTICFLEHSTIDFEQKLWKKYFNNLFFAQELFKIPKLFKRLEQKPWIKEFLISFGNFFINKNLLKNIFFFKNLFNKELKNKVQIFNNFIFFKLLKKIKKKKIKFPILFQKFLKTDILFHFPGIFYFVKISFSKLHQKSFKFKIKN